MAAIIFDLIILLTLVVGLSASRGQKASKIENYLVGGRSFGGLLFFFLMVGEIYSIGTMIGLPGGIYSQGPSYGLWVIFFWVIP